jgi:DNA-binding LacI/PurR family transcriptional regulator
MTLAAIARRIGVSPATVSKVLNDRPDVAADTRRRVRAALDAYGYGRRDSQHSNLIDLVVIELDDPYAAAVISSFERAARRRGLSIVPSVAGAQQVPDDLVDRILSRDTRGVITIFADLADNQQSALQSHGIPHVVVAGGRPATNMINVDFRSGVRQATDHLIAGGHCRIGLLLGRRDLIFSRQRLLGYQDALRRAGLLIDWDLITWGRFDKESGAALTRRLLQLDDPPTAIIAGSDTMAIGVYDAVAQLGRTVGPDIAVVGFDDRPQAAWLDPPLTTVRMPIAELAEAAVEALIEQDSQPESPPALPGTLVVRQSTEWVRRGSADDSGDGHATVSRLHPSWKATTSA